MFAPGNLEGKKKTMAQAAQAATKHELGEIDKSTKEPNKAWDGSWSGHGTVPLCVLCVWTFCVHVASVFTSPSLLPSFPSSRQARPLPSSFPFLILPLDRSIHTHLPPSIPSRPTPPFHPPPFPPPSPPPSLVAPGLNPPFYLGQFKHSESPAFRPACFPDRSSSSGSSGSGKGGRRRGGGRRGLGGEGGGGGGGGGWLVVALCVVFLLVLVLVLAADKRECVWCDE